MSMDRASLAAIAERIAEWEGRVARLRERVERLRSEGNDTAQAQGALQVVARNLTNLYVRQSVMRRTAWAWSHGVRPYGTPSSEAMSRMEGLTPLHDPMARP